MGERGVALVTGAGRKGGIGRAAALRLADGGFDLAVLDLGGRFDDFPDYETAPASDLDETAKLIEARGASAMAIRADVSDADDVEAAVSAVKKRFGRLDLLVNNAGLGIGIGPFTQVTEAQWDKNFDVMPKGTFLCCRYAVPLMISGGGGRIINVASQAGLKGFPFLAPYSAAKFAVVGFTQAIAQELGPLGITANCVCPGTVDTPLLRIGGTASDEGIAKLVEKTVPLKRAQTPEDVAGVIAFLAGPDGAYLTGAALNISGGQTIV